MKYNEMIDFLEGLKNSFTDVEKMAKEISSRELWNKNINGLNQTINLLKITDDPKPGAISAERRHS